MNKRDNAIKNIINNSEIEDIINRSKICHVGMVDNDLPYVLGFNFGYENQTIYLHCAKEGKKINILRKNNNVCVEFDIDHDFFSRHENVACSWRMRYRSVLAYGKAIFVENYEEKIEGLKIFMKHYSYKKFEFSLPSVNNIEIIKIKIDNVTGRKFEYI